MAIRCGRCSCYHEDVASVRECYNGGYVAVTDAPSLGAVARNGGPSPKQKELINSLRAQLGHKALGEEVMDTFDRSTTRSVIDDLFIDIRQAKAEGTLMASPAQLKRQIQAADFPTVTEGYYAAQSGRTGQIDFFKVDKPEDGTWQGCLFVKRVLGGSADDTPRTERVPQGQAVKWLKIIRGHESASKEFYGRSIGRCGECGRQLTDETSRALGIGPVCVTKGY